MCISFFATNHLKMKFKIYQSYQTMQVDEIFTSSSILTRWLDGEDGEPREKNERDDALVAARTGDYDAVKKNLILFEEFPTLCGRAFSSACNYGFIEIVKLLLPLTVAEQRTKGFENACASGKLDIAEILIQTSIDISSNGKNLRFATRYGHIDIVKLLLDNGVDVNVNDGEALWWAAKTGNEDIVRLLLAHKPLTGIQSAYYTARSEGYYRIANLILSRFA